MAEHLNGLMDELVDNIGNLAGSLGVSRVAGQLYILLFLNDRPLSLDEMTKKLRISKGHVSTNIRALERWQAVRKVWIKGSRKDYYKANTNTLSIIANQLEQGMRQRGEELEKVIGKSKRSIANLKDVQSKEEIKNLEDKIKKIDKMHQKVNGLLKKLNLLQLLK